MTKKSEELFPNIQPPEGVKKVAEIRIICFENGSDLFTDVKTSGKHHTIALALDMALGQMILSIEGKEVNNKISNYKLIKLYQQ